MAGGLFFLVLEDDEIVRRALVRALGRFGKVDAVGTCAAARMAIRARNFDAAVLDVRLPDGTGLDLVEPVRARNPAVCVLVLTGSTEHDVIAKVHARKASYLLKPFDPKQLAILAQEAEDRRDARDRRTSLIVQRWTQDSDLSSAEAELLALGAEGVAREEFARIRGVKPDTIRKQIQSLLRKTGHDTFEAAVNGLLREALAEPT
jgi:DNA-binding NarL/FixJ family response regulator